MPKNSVICKDVIAGLRDIDDDSLDLVILDPPYNIGKNFHSTSFRMEMNKYADWMEEIILLSLKKLRAGGIVYLYGFPENVAHISVRFPINNQRWLVWQYKNKVVPSLNLFQRTHETVLMLWKDKPNFDRDSVRIPYTDSFIKNAAGKKRSPSLSRFNNNLDKEMYYEAHPNGALPRDVFDFPTLAGGTGINERIVYNKTKGIFIKNAEIKNYQNDEIIKHPTQKPIKLTQYLIKSVKTESDKLNIAIPFSGTGVESWVAKQMGHNSIAFDINKDYVKMANQLLKEWKPK